MNLSTIRYLNLSVLVLINANQAIAEKPIQDLFPTKQVIAERQINNISLNRRNFNATKRYVSVFGYLDNKTLLSNVYLYDTNGKLLWEKQLPFVDNTVITDESDKVIVLYDIDRYGAKGVNACFDRSGNKLWQLKVPVPGIEAMSPDGKYGITRVASEENGKFRVFDLELGIELETHIPQGSHGFRAQFIDSEHVVVLTQNIDVARDTVALRRVLRIKREGGFNPRKGVPNTWINTYHPAMFIIYHIPSHTIVTQRKLFSLDGEPLYVPMQEGNYMSISIDKEHIAIALRKRNLSNLSLVQVDLQGNIEWENSELPKSKIPRAISKIYGLFDLGNGTILINEPEPSYHLVDRTNGRTLWRAKAEGKESNIIRQIFIEDNTLVLHTSYYGWNSKIHTIDITSGAVLKDPEDLGQIVMFNNRVGAMIYNHSQKQLQFLK